MSPLIHIEKLYQDTVWITQTYAMDVESVDAWAATVQDYITHISSSERYMVFDLTAIPRPGVTLYMNKRVTELAKSNRDAAGRVGVVISLNPTIRYIFEPFIRFTSSQFQPNLKIQLFGDREAALNWVIEALPQKIKDAGR